MSEWFINLGYSGQLATWLVASFLLYTLASQLAWQFRWYFSTGSITADDQTPHLPPEQDWEQDDTLGRVVDRLHDHLVIPWVEEGIRFAYYLGIPFLAAVNGLLPADLLGIGGTNWVDDKSIRGFLWEDWMQGFGLALVAVVTMMAVWFIGRLVSRRAALIPLPPGLPGPIWQRLLHAVYDQVHWAFYRSGPILWLDDLYWGTFAGLALVLLEAALNPALRWSLKSPETAKPPLFRLGMAWLSALLFLATQNLWLTLGTHLILVALLGEREASNPSIAYQASD